MPRTETRPEWLVPGAKVVLYSTGGASTPRNVVITTITKVATKSFTVENSTEPRFRIDTLSCRQGGTWGWTRHVVPADSDEGRAEIAAEQRRRKVLKAEWLCEAWIRLPDEEGRLAAIAALQALGES